MDTILYFQSQGKINAADKLSGVQSIAAKCGWHVQVVEGLPMRSRLKSLLDFWHPVGIIVECGGTEATVDPGIFGEIPSVFFDHDPSCLPRNAFCVTHDSTATAQMAARELMLGGETSFAFVPHPERRFWSDERERGFVSALSLNGHGCRVFSGTPSRLDPVRYQRKLRAFLTELPKPCALFAANDSTAKEVLTAAVFAQISVPEDLSVIGVDNVPEICERTEPTLSSVRPDFRRGGELAALMLLARTREGAKHNGLRRRTFGPLEVVRRASTRRLPAMDCAVADALERIRREACLGLKAETVLKAFGCSRRLAEIRFRRITGHSVLDEIHVVRLDRAKRILAGDDTPLKAISDFCGFKNPNSMRKFFLKSTGKTMSKWRMEAKIGLARKSIAKTDSGLKTCDPNRKYLCGGEARPCTATPPNAPTHSHPPYATVRISALK